MRKRSLLPVNGLLDSLFQNLGISERIRIETLRRKWHTIIAEPLSNHTAPVDLKDGKLVIAVDSPAWLHHLKFLKKEMADKLKPHGVSDIRLKLGNVRIDSERQIPDNVALPESFRELTADEITRIDRTIEDIEDGELKDVIKHVMEKSMMRKM
jgi:predicted nucleic acid-binding Zn ribbon protein